MEVILHRDEEEEEEAAALRPRQRHKSTEPLSITTSEEEVRRKIDKNEGTLVEWIDLKKSGPYSRKNEMLRINLCLDNNQVTTLQWSSLDKKVRVEDVQIPILANAVINYLGTGQDGIMSGLKQTLREKQDLHDEIAVDIGEYLISDEEEIMEIELEGAVSKVDTHAPYCPNCHSLIDKVILRRVDNDMPHPEKPLNRFGCFSIFIPSGILKNHLSISKSYEEQESAGSDEEIIEMKLDSAVKKVLTHNTYCLYCNSRLTKVILRRRKKDTPHLDKPKDLLGCLSCFSIFIPLGNCLNLFNIYGNKQERMGHCENSNDYESEIYLEHPNLPCPFPVDDETDHGIGAMTARTEPEIEIKKQHNPNFQLLLGNEGESIDYEYEQTALVRSQMTKTALGMGNEFRFIADGDPLYQVHTSVAMQFNLKRKVVDLIL